MSHTDSPGKLHKNVLSQDKVNCDEQLSGRGDGTDIYRDLARGSYLTYKSLDQLTNENYSGKLSNFRSAMALACGSFRAWAKGGLSPIVVNRSHRDAIHALKYFAGECVHNKDFVRYITRPGQKPKYNKAMLEEDITKAVQAIKEIQDEFSRKSLRLDRDIYFKDSWPEMVSRLLERGEAG